MLMYLNLFEFVTTHFHLVSKQSEFALIQVFLFFTLSIPLPTMKARLLNESFPPPHHVPASLLVLALSTLQSRDGSFPLPPSFLILRQLVELLSYRGRQSSTTFTGVELD